MTAANLEVVDLFPGLKQALEATRGCETGKQGKSWPSAYLNFMKLPR